MYFQVRLYVRSSLVDNHVHYCCTDPLQDGDTPLHDATTIGYSAIVKHLLSIPGIVYTCMNIQNKVSTMVYLMMK